MIQYNVMQTGYMPVSMAAELRRLMSFFEVLPSTKDMTLAVVARQIRHCSLRISSLFSAVGIKCR